MLFTIDPYYDIKFFNRTLEALKNNKVPYELFVENKAPFNFYIESAIQPVYLDYDMLSPSRERNLVSIVQSHTPQNDYKYMRRESFSGQKGFEYYTLNNAFRQMQKSKEAYVFHTTPEHAKALSQKYPRKIYFLGRYLNNSYVIFQQDSLLVQNYIHDIPHRVLYKGKSFRHATEIEQEINYKQFAFRDRLIKLDITPYLLEGRYYPPIVQNEYRKKFILENETKLDDLSKEELIRLLEAKE